MVLLKGRKPGDSTTQSESDVATGTVSRQLMVDGMASYGDLNLRVDRIIAPAPGVETRSCVAVTVRTVTAAGNSFQTREENFLINQGESAEIGDYVVVVRDVQKSNQEDLDQCTLDIERTSKTRPRGSSEPPSGTTDTDLAAKYGISEEDLKLFGLGNLAELGKGVVTISGEPGEGGKARVSLTEAYAAELQFQDVREPYVIIRGRLSGIQPADRALLENTLYLEKDKPTLLGLTNLKDALMLIVRLHDKP